MNLSDLLPAKRVREIAEAAYGNASGTAIAYQAINAATPLIAAAVLEWAAERMRVVPNGSNPVLLLEEWAKEIKP